MVRLLILLTLLLHQSCNLEGEDPRFRGLGTNRIFFPEIILPLILLRLMLLIPSYLFRGNLVVSEISIMGEVKPKFSS